jgi:hypothetical protein
MKDAGYKPEFAQQNSILKPAGLETPSGRGKDVHTSRSFAQQNSILKPAGLETPSGE